MASGAPDSVPTTVVQPEEDTHTSTEVGEGVLPVQWTRPEGPSSPYQPVHPNPYEPQPQSVRSQRVYPQPPSPIQSNRKTYTANQYHRHRISVSLGEDLPGKKRVRWGRNFGTSQESTQTLAEGQGSPTSLPRLSLVYVSERRSGRSWVHTPTTSLSRLPTSTVPPF